MTQSEDRKEQNPVRGTQVTRASNLFSAVTNGKLVSSATAAAIFTSNLIGRHGIKKHCQLKVYQVTKMFYSQFQQITSKVNEEI